MLALGIAPVSGLVSRSSSSPSPPRSTDFDPERPILILVRGWLWDPLSRKEVPPLEFASQMNEFLQQEQVTGTVIVEWRWSRVPADIFDADREFTSFARAANAEAARSGHCVNYLGHSAGAALVYSAASHGVRMGYMGTLGLPTRGSARPGSVMQWENFYTSTQSNDIEGRFWASDMAADHNIDLKMPHRNFWESSEVARITAVGIARSWNECRP